MSDWKLIISIHHPNNAFILFSKYWLPFGDNVIVDCICSQSVSAVSIVMIMKERTRISTKFDTYIW